MEAYALPVQALLHCTGGGLETIEAPIERLWWNWLFFGQEAPEVLVFLGFIRRQASRWIPPKETSQEIEASAGCLRIESAQGDSFTSWADSPNETVGIGLLGQPIELVV